MWSWECSWVCDHFVISAAMHCQTSASEEHWPLSPVSPRHKKFRLTLLFKPFLMKSTEKWNWLMPNEYHWIAVIVRLMFVTLKLFIKHQFHLKSGHAMKCADSPLRFPMHYRPPVERRREGSPAVTSALLFYMRTCITKTWYNLEISTNSSTYLMITKFYLIVGKRLKMVMVYVEMSHNVIWKQLIRNM